MNQIIQIVQDLDKLSERVEAMYNDINSRISYLLSDSIPEIEAVLQDEFGSGIDEVDINLSYIDGEFLLSFDNIHEHKVFNHNSGSYTMNDVSNFLEQYISELIDKEFEKDWEI